MNHSNFLADFLTLEELALFFRTINRLRDKVMFQLMYRFGLRVSELRLLFIQDVNLETGRIRISRLKGSASQEYPLPKDIKEMLGNYLEKYRKTQVYLFLSREGNPISRNQVFHLYRKYYAKAKLTDPQKRNPRCLRHSFAVHAFQVGQDRNYVQMMLGIKNMHCVLAYEKRMLLAAGYSQAIIRGNLIQLSPKAKTQSDTKKTAND